MKNEKDGMDILADQINKSKSQHTPHTPGPWSWNHGPRDSEFDTITGPKGFFICEIAISHPENEANARLIAAAPELLEALKIGIETMLNGPERILRQDEQEAIMKMRTAIAKAEGR